MELNKRGSYACILFVPSVLLRRDCRLGMSSIPWQCCCSRGPSVPLPTGYSSAGSVLGWIGGGEQGNPSPQLHKAQQGPNWSLAARRLGSWKPPSFCPIDFILICQKIKKNEREREPVSQTSLSFFVLEIWLRFKAVRVPTHMKLCSHVEGCGLPAALSCQR